MHVELGHGTEADRVVVRCDDSVLGQALEDLYFVHGDGVYTKRFLAGSCTDAILERFREALVPLLRQTARLVGRSMEQASIGGSPGVRLSLCVDYRSSRAISTS